jgi:hypothetical protein
LARRGISQPVRAQIRRPIVLCAVLLSACTTPSQQPSQRDLSAYIEHLTQWAPQEAEVGRAVRRILDTEFADEAEVRRQIAESVPRVDAQLALLRAYHPAGNALQDVHAGYVQAWETLRAAYTDIIEGFDRSDQATLGRGRQELLAWRRALPDTAKRLRELAGATNETGPPT